MYQGKKVQSLFPIKDKINIEHLSDLVYGFFENDKEAIDYVGETNVRYGTRTEEHLGRDKNSAVYKRIQENTSITIDNFTILGKGYAKAKDRKIAEALFVKDLDPPLNRQIKSHRLYLFND